jgi:hypothetical protein
VAQGGQATTTTASANDRGEAVQRKCGGWATLRRGTLSFWAGSRVNHLIIGTTIGALTMPAVAACGTWVIGKVFMKHFASGGTLLDFNPPDYRELLRCKRRSSLLELERQLPLLRQPRHPRLLTQQPRARLPRTLDGVRSRMAYG